MYLLSSIVMLVKWCKQLHRTLDVMTKIAVIYVSAEVKHVMMAAYYIGQATTKLGWLTQKLVS